MIVNMLSNEKLNPIWTELFIIYFFCAKKHCTNSTHSFIVKTSDRRQLQQIVFNHSSDIDIKVFMNLYKKFTAKPYSFLVIDATFASDNLLRFNRKNRKTNHANWW